MTFDLVGGNGGMRPHTTVGNAICRHRDGARIARFAFVQTSGRPTCHRAILGVFKNFLIYAASHDSLLIVLANHQSQRQQNPTVIANIARMNWGDATMAFDHSNSLITSMTVSLRKPQTPELV